MLLGNKKFNIKDLLILVVDEDLKIQEEICDLLQQLGVTRLLCSSDPQQALDLLDEKINKDQVDLMLVNYQLAQMPSSVLIAGAKLRQPDMIIIAYSTCNDATAHARTLILGASDYFKKDSRYTEETRQKLNDWLNLAVRNCEFCSIGA